MPGAIEALEAIAAMLAAESLTAKEAAHRLGTVEDPGHGLPLRVTPSDARLGAISVAAHSESPAVAHVEIAFAEGERPAVAALSSAFGAYLSPPRVHADSPNRIVFRHARQGQAANITVIATLPAGSGDPAGASAESVTLRCDAAS